MIENDGRNGVDPRSVMNPFVQLGVENIETFIVNVPLAFLTNQMHLTRAVGVHLEVIPFAGFLPSDCVAPTHSGVFGNIKHNLVELVQTHQCF